MEDEIDLGKYVAVLLRQWQLILSATLVCAVVAGVVSLAWPKSYEARVLVAATKSASSVSFGSAIKTTSEDQLAVAGAQAVIDRKSRLQSFVELVPNPAVAQVVLETVGDRLKADEREIPKLLRMVKGDLARNSDSIEIAVTYSNPEVAAAIANAWGNEYVRQINLTYSGAASGESYTVVQQETARTKSAYDTAQAALEDFILNNTISELNRRIDQLQSTINNLSSARNTAVSTVINTQLDSEQKIIKSYYDAQAENQLLALQQDQDARRQVISQYIDAQNDARRAVFDEQVQDRLITLTRVYSDTRRVEQLLETATDMRDQVQKGGAAAAASNALALTLLKAQIFADHGEPNNTNLQIQTVPAAVNGELMVADLDALIATLEARQSALDKQISTLSDELLNGKGFAYTDVPLENTGDLISVIQKRYPELFQTGSLTDLSLKVIEQGNPLIDEARARSKDLLELKRLEGQVDFTVTDTPLEKKVRDLEAQVRDLQSQVAQQTSQQQELTRARDLAWSTYTNLATKEAELGVAAQTTGVEVALAAPAAVPDQDTMSGALNVAVATVLGLMLGVFAAFAVEYWQGYKGLEPQPVPVFAIMRSWGGAASSRVRPAATEKAVVESAPLEEKPGPAGASLSDPPALPKAKAHRPRQDRTQTSRPRPKRRARMKNEQPGPH